MSKDLYEWVFEFEGNDGVSDKVDFVLGNADKEVLRYTLSINELLGLLQFSSETRDSIASLILGYRQANLDLDTILISQYQEIE